jgi:hypothetical protein
MSSRIPPEEWAEETVLLEELQALIAELQHAISFHQGSSQEWRERREEIAAFREQLRLFRARWGRGEEQRQ